MALLVLSGIASITCPTEKAAANPVPYPLIRMPEEYIYANITVSDENAYARVNTTYPFTENDFNTVSMSYPLPVNSTNVNVRVDGNETFWWYTNQTYETVYGSIPVINWTISPAPSQFVVNVDYDHEVLKVGQNYTYFYPMGTWKSLEGIYNKLTTAYVTVDVNNINVSNVETLDISAYQIGVNSTTDEWTWKPLRYSVSRTNGNFRISATVNSYLFSPILDDLVIAFKKREMRTVRVTDDYPTIQSAIDAANYEDTVLVTSGIYHEHLSVWKSIYLVSEGEVIIDANNSGSAVEITADYVHFCGFTMQNSGTTELPVFASCGLIIASNGCNITHNLVRNSHVGIFLYAMNDNVLTNNSMIGNKYNFFFYNFGIGGRTVESCLNDVDTSNTVNGKPIYYWVGQHDREVPEDAGYVAVIGSTSITVKDLMLSNNSDGILFWNTNDSIIQNVKVIDNYFGIYLYYSNNNSIHHNNFIDNTHANAYCYSSSNVWHHYDEGNYWSDYTGTDSDEDGIGDMPVTIDAYNIDHCPLVGTFSNFNTSSGYPVEVVSNSTIEDFAYFDSNSTIRMHVSNITANQTVGFCRIAIPHALMNETYYVTIDGVEPYFVNYTLYDNGTHRWIYIAYQLSTHEIVIVPEFLLASLVPIFMLVTLLATVAQKARKRKQ
jgi:parallel beta-helix repeat protein